MSENHFHSVYLDAALCVGCTTCIKRCPTQAIRVREGKAHIMEERCIDCGECIRACPKGAKKSVSDPLAMMDGFDYKVALPAPSLYGHSYGLGDISSALLSLGFDEVFDVAWGAEVLSDAIVLCQGYDQSQGSAQPRISSACPVVVRLIQLRFPSLIANLVPLLPPVEIAAREFRRHLAEGPSFTEGGTPKVGVFFISPCTSKVTAIKSPLGYATSAVDAVFSFQDIYPTLKKALKRGEQENPAQKNSFFVQAVPRLGRGLGWARSDGELEALDLAGAVSVDGIENVIALFEEIDNGKLDAIPYIEALACPGGCVGGPMAVANPHVARTVIKALSRENRVDSPVQTPLFPLFWDKELQPKPVMVLHRDMKRALEMAEGMEILTADLPGLDCGACGAPDCAALAEDIVKGQAHLEDCLIKLRSSYRY
ncbi:MAG: Fe-S cluster domain-containing protein [Spirochaetes bacterium]|nr:MAG: Fe-S cluster domain-containing protein [Spirochaetota bacterium]